MLNVHIPKKEKVELQKAIYRLSTGEEILLNTDPVPEDDVFLLLVYSDDAAKLVNLFFETVHTHHGKDIGQAARNDANADNG